MLYIFARVETAARPWHRAADAQYSYVTMDKWKCSLLEEQGCNMTKVGEMLTTTYPTRSDS